MCKNASKCSELGSDPQRWPKESLLPVPAYFDEEFRHFSTAIRLAADGNKNGALNALGLVRSSALQIWYTEHGLESGRIRSETLHIPVSRPNVPNDSSRRSSSRDERSIFERDGFRCRYCGIRLVSREVFRAFRDVVGSSTFSLAKPDLKRHGAALIFFPTIDHVDHWMGGGRTDLNNLVTTCFACNFGKYHYTVAQLGLDDPRGRKIQKLHDWDGLVNLLPKLRSVVRH